MSDATASVRSAAIRTAAKEVRNAALGEADAEFRRQRTQGVGLVAAWQAYDEARHQAWMAYSVAVMAVAE